MVASSGGDCFGDEVVVESSGDLASNGVFCLLSGPDFSLAVSEDGLGSVDATDGVVEPFSTILSSSDMNDKLSESKVEIESLSEIGIDLADGGVIL